MALSSLEITEILLRVVVATELSVLALVFLRERSSSAVYSAAAFLSLCVIGYMLAPLLLSRTNLPQLGFPAAFLASLAPTAFWYFCYRIFADKQRPPRLVFLPLLLTVIIIVLSLRTFSPNGLDAVDRVSQGIKLLWLAAALYTVFRDWRADLVSPRIRLRRWLLALGAGYIAIIVVVELLLTGPAPTYLELLNVTGILALVTAVVFSLLTLNQHNLLAQIAGPVRGSKAEPSALAQRVLDSMGEQRAYAMEGLTLDRLAEELSCQPPQLRQVINTELGHRNFNAFINLYRIQEIAARMALDEYRDTPLLTLALDAGFRSLAPFNRSFREHYKVTPSEYRASISQK